MRVESCFLACAAQRHSQQSPPPQGGLPLHRRGQTGARGKRSIPLAHSLLLVREGGLGEFAVHCVSVFVHSRLGVLSNSHTHRCRPFFQVSEDRMCPTGSPQRYLLNLGFSPSVLPVLSGG